MLFNLVHCELNKSLLSIIESDVNLSVPEADAEVRKKNCASINYFLILRLCGRKGAVYNRLFVQM